MKREGFTFYPIGTVRTGRKYRFEAPRQGVFSEGSGVLELLPEYGGDAVADLAGFERLWLIFCFHLNEGHRWKAKVRPPFPADGICRSLFATRSPYRVNPVGLSCARIEAVEKNRIILSELDLLDGTPVLDIKPYIPEADAFPEAAAGWRDQAADELWQVSAGEAFRRQAEYLQQISGLDVGNFAKIQLCRAPLSKSRKRLEKVAENVYALGCRTWKLIFSCDAAAQQVKLEKVISNYPLPELASGAEDRYGDKNIHRQFLRLFPDCRLEKLCECGILSADGSVNQSAKDQ